MIYFIQETGLFRNRVKIGLTDNLKQRLRRLRNMSPSTLKLLLVLPGDIQEEAYYHERFAEYHIHGEWFKYGLKLQLFIRVNQAKFIRLSSDITQDPIKTIDPVETTDPIKTTEEIEIEIDKIEAEKALIKAYTEYTESSSSDTPSWRTITQICFGDGKYGTFYTQKLIAVLDKYDVNRTMLPENGGT